jgi:hypothetical protein
MADLRVEIEAYERMEAELKATLNGKWILIHDGVLINSFDSFESAADEAVEKFGRGPFLIRQVGAGPATLPISVMYAWNAQS